MGPLPVLSMGWQWSRNLIPLAGENEVHRAEMSLAVELVISYNYLLRLFKINLGNNDSLSYKYRHKPDGRFVGETSLGPQYPRLREWLWNIPGK